MTQEEIRTELLKVAGGPELTPEGELYLDGFSKKAHELMEKEALPLSALMNIGWALPGAIYAGSNLAGAAGSALKGEGTDAMRQAGLAGLGALGSLPFLGGAGAGVGQIGLAMQRLAKGKKSPAFRAMMPGKATGVLGHSSKFRKALRYPGTKVLQGLTKVLGPERATALGKTLAAKGKHVSEIKPLRFMDRGIWGKTPPPIGMAGMFGSMIPMMGTDAAIRAVTTPSIHKLESQLAQSRNQVPSVPRPVSRTGGLFSKVKEWDNANNPSRQYARQMGLI
jgi:hypothetical protein